MKLNKLKDSLVGLAIVLFFNGCNSLDISNLWNYDAELVWNDDNLATAYVTDLYGDIFKGWDTGADNTAEQQTGIPFMLSTITTSGSGYKRWNYTNIRNINLGIEYLAEGTCSESVKNSLTGQMLFMRAYQYGEMIVYHGGMPYITKVQDKDKDDLFVTRNSTAECFDLLIKDLDDAISLLPAKAKGNDYGRIDQCFAKAYKAKMLLYKASPQFNPSNRYDNKYSYVAANKTEIIASSVVNAANELGSKVIVAATMSGHSARAISNLRPNAPILATVPTRKVARTLALSYGVYPVVVNEYNSTDEVINDGVTQAKKFVELNSGDKIVIAGGFPNTGKKTTNFMKIEEIE